LYSSNQCRCHRNCRGRDRVQCSCPSSFYLRSGTSPSARMRSSSPRCTAT
jgi:hypothetical protein